MVGGHDGHLIPRVPQPKCLNPPRRLSGQIGCTPLIRCIACAYLQHLRLTGPDRTDGKKGGRPAGAATIALALGEQAPFAG